MANIKKFLDRDGVSVLWSGIASELAKKANVNDVYTKDEVDSAIAAAAYDDAIIKADIKANADAIELLNGDSAKEGSVAYKIAQIVVENGGAIDTLNEIAAWIAAHPESVTVLNEAIKANTDAIDDLAALVGKDSVADQIADALQKSNLSQYASAQGLADAILRIAANESAISTLQGTVADHGSRLTTVEGKVESNSSSITNLSGRLDGIVAQGGEPNVINNIKVNGVVQTIADDKSVDIEVPVLEALTTAEIKSACGITE